MNHLTAKLLSVLPALITLPNVALAMPSVSDDSITWPSDGWYQVQSADTFETVCEGSNSNTSSAGGPCLVSEGSYIVINHSTGERYENIRVTDSTAAESISDGGESGSVPAVSTNGPIIAWPDNGWYQVQNASNYATVCEGGTSCSVAPGSYNVINHTTGERFTDILVSASTVPGDTAASAGVEVDGDTIRWPDDGWYQVQAESNYSSVCEGGRECQVSPGRYIVINHSSGERLQVDVGSSIPSPTDPVEAGSVSVTFQITVPIYVSNELQVHLAWGDEQTTANWVVDESWQTTLELPSNIENALSITFSDRNGSITLGTVDTNFRTGTDTIQQVMITAGQFNTERWDDDGDGQSNLEEALDTGSYTAFNMLEVSQDLIETVAGYQLEWLEVVVDDFAYIVEQLRPINWPDGAYYQVQNAEDFRVRGEFIPATYATMCEGESVCMIEPGIYDVTNHDTGERSSLDVAYLDPADNPATVPLPSYSITVADDLLVATTGTVERRQYACEHGGSLVLEDSITVTDFSDGRAGVGKSTRRGYSFNDCQMTLHDGLVPAGEYRLNGSMNSDRRTYNGYDAAENSVRYEYENLSIVSGDGFGYQVQGELDILEYSGGYGRRANIEEYRKTLSGGTTAEYMSGIDFDMGYRRLRVNGTLQNAQTGNQQVVISSNPELRQEVQRVGSGYDLIVPSSGTIEMRAEGGGLLFMQGNPIRIDDRWGSPRWLVDLDYTNDSGEQSLESEIDVSRRPFYAAENCGLYEIARRNPDSQRYMCMGGYFNRENFGRDFMVP